MAKFLIHGRTLLSSLFKRMGTEESLDYSLVVLRSNSRINGYVSSRSLDIIERDIESYFARDGASYSCNDITRGIIRNIEAGFIVCPVSAQTIQFARQLNAPFDTALEISCAIDQNVDFILTQNVDDFRTCGWPIMSMEEWLETVWPQPINQRKLVIVDGGLGKIQRLSEFCFSSDQDEIQYTPDVSELPNQVVDLGKWKNAKADLEWQPIEKIVDIPPQYRQMALRFNHRKERAKSLSFANSNDLVLLVSYEPVPGQDVDLQISLFSKDLTSQIPGRVELSILDMQEQFVVREWADNPQNIQVQFNGEKGEVFFLVSKFGAIEHVEKFLI